MLFLLYLCDCCFYFGVCYFTNILFVFFKCDFKGITMKKKEFFKKGQIALVFPLIVALLLIVVLVVVGFSGVDDIMAGKKTADFITFSDTITRSFQRNNDYGSVTQETFMLPGDMDILCVVSQKAIEQKALLSDDVSVVVVDYLSDELMRLISVSINSGVTTNIFLSNNQTIRPIASSKYIDLGEKTILCKQAINSRIMIRMDGLGRTTRISFP
jgi:hypothetical protein